MAASSCLFCDIASGKRPGFLVHADEETAAFLDIHPLAIGHVLVVPRRHVVTLAEADDATVSALMLKVRDLTGVLPPALGADGTFVLQNNTISQSVPHLHVHVVPRRKGDRLFSDALVWRRVRYRDEAHMTGTAEVIRRALNP